MAHWYLKAMTVPAALRNKFQMVRTKSEFRSVLDEIADYGAQVKGDSGELPALRIPVPAGPVEHW
jgi:hypothetical protein